MGSNKMPRAADQESIAASIFTMLNSTIGMYDKTTDTILEGSCPVPVPWARPRGSPLHVA